MGVLVASGAAIGQALFANRYVPPLRESCVASVDGTGYELDPDQAANAALITAIAVQREMPARAATIAIATAIQESKLRNIDYGDRDSLGLFQQRPSQGWGTQAQVMDPVYATNAFYDALARIEGYEDDGDHRRRAGGAALRLPRGVRRPRARGPGLRLGAHRLLAGLARLPAARRRRGGRPGSPRGRGPRRPRRPARRAHLGRHRRRPATIAAPAADDEAGLRRAWAAAHWAVASADEYDVVRVQVGTRVWDRTGAEHGLDRGPRRRPGRP